VDSPSDESKEEASKKNKKEAEGYGATEDYF
jgi:hypothetical protein